MNVNGGHHHHQQQQSRFKSFLWASRLKGYAKRARKSDACSENASGSNSTSGTILASPILNDKGSKKTAKSLITKLGSLDENSNYAFQTLIASNAKLQASNITGKYKHLNYENLTDYQLHQEQQGNLLFNYKINELKQATGQSTSEEEEDIDETTRVADGVKPNGRLNYKPVSLKAFMQKMTTRKSRLKSIKKVNRNKLASNYDNDAGTDYFEVCLYFLFNRNQLSNINFKANYTENVCMFSFICQGIHFVARI